MMNNFSLLGASVIVASVTAACNPAHADQFQFGNVQWENNAHSDLVVKLDTSNACVTKTGPAAFTVQPGRLVVSPLTVQPGCDAFIRWTFTQDRKILGGKLTGTISYTQTAGYEARITITYTNQPNKRLRHYFRAGCGSANLFCINTTVNSHTLRPAVFIVAYRLPAELITINEITGMRMPRK